MNYLIFSDPHLTDNTLEEYRWEVFNHLQEAALKYAVDEIYCLGDLVNTKDRHSALLVNKLVDAFSLLQCKTNTQIKILSGNHEKPITGPYFWLWLNRVGIDYITSPVSIGGIYFLPFAANPAEEWKTLDFNSASMLLMHQTGQGVKVEGDRLLASNNLPKFPSIPIFSGDVHRPQEVEGITYVGTPHPVRFSETWNNRIILIQDANFEKPVSIWLPSIKRAIIDITNSKELDKLPYKKNDQVKIRYTLTGKQLNTWPEEQQEIKKWALSREVYIASIEPKFIGDGVQIETNKEMLAFELMSPDEIVTKFAADEKLSTAVLEVGRSLLRSV